MSMCKTTPAPGNFSHGQKLPWQGGLPGVVQWATYFASRSCPGQQKTHVDSNKGHGKVLCQPLTLHPSIPWEIHFCAIHPLDELFSSFGELFSRRPLSCQSIHPFWAICFCAVNPFGELSSCRSCNNSPSVHPFGKLFLCCPSLGRVIFI